MASTHYPKSLLDSPLTLSREMALILDNDRIAASQIKEHLGVDRLLEILDIPRPSFAETEYERMLHLIVNHFPKSEILKALNQAKAA